MKRKTTREADFEILEQGVSEAQTTEGKLQRKAALEMIWEQIKDPYLEKMRIALIDALKYGDLQKMAEIRKKVEEYAKSPSFVWNQLKAKKRILGRR